MTGHRLPASPIASWCLKPDGPCAPGRSARCCMLNHFLHGQLQLGLAQAAVAALAAILVALLAHKRRIHLEGETAIALARGLIQIVAVGSVLVLLLRGPRWTGWFLLAVMIAAAGATSRRRAKGIPGAFKIS